MESKSSWLGKRAKEVVIGVIVTVLGTVALSGYFKISSMNKKRKVAEILQRYANDMNNGRFDAAEYFAPIVQKFIKREALDPFEINKIIHEQLPQSQKNYIVSFDTDNMEVLTENEQEIVVQLPENDSYYFTADKKMHIAKISAIFHFNPELKIRSLEHKPIRQTTPAL